MSRSTFSRRVLVADADPERAATLRALLHAWGHTVAVAADGLSALRRAESFRPDAVVVGPAAYAVGRRLRQSPALDGVLLVAVTADTLDPAVARWFDACVVTPFDPEQLRALVATGAAHSLGA
jgi:CheY-like chemotaxis protein